MAPAQLLRQLPSQPLTQLAQLLRQLPAQPLAQLAQWLVQRSRSHSGSR